jgi:ATP:corrinoid adenosyltransferase
VIPQTVIITVRLENDTDTMSGGYPYAEGYYLEFLFPGLPIMRTKRVKIEKFDKSNDTRIQQGIQQANECAAHLRPHYNVVIGDEVQNSLQKKKMELEQQLEEVNKKLQTTHIR